MLNETQAKESIHRAIQDGVEIMGREWLTRELPLILNNWGIVEDLYSPDITLVNRLSQFEKWCKTKKDEDAGELMEEVAFLSFRCLKGYSSVKSYQSFAAQIDLIISGSSPEWITIMNYLHLDAKYRAIAIEAKNLTAKVDDKQFSRFCYHMQNTFESTAQLGIFFTRVGATGFSKIAKPPNDIARQRVLRDAQATQILFHAKTGKFVVVLEHNDILKLSTPGSLLRILESKIRTIEQWSGIATDASEATKEIDLPSHLSRHL